MEGKVTSKGYEITVTMSDEERRLLIDIVKSGKSAFGSQAHYNVGSAFERLLQVNN